MDASGMTEQTSRLETTTVHGLCECQENSTADDYNRQSIEYTIESSRHRHTKNHSSRRRHMQYWAWHLHVLGERGGDDIGRQP